jgi:CheY-like chemotaxis protein
MMKDRMSVFEPTICESFRSDLAGNGQQPYLCVTGSAEFHRQAFWCEIEKTGHVVRRFMEDRTLLDVVRAGSASAVIYEVPARREGVIQFLNQLAELNHDACVILVGPEIGAELVAQCLQKGAIDYLTIPIIAKPSVPYATCHMNSYNRTICLPANATRSSIGIEISWP